MFVIFIMNLYNNKHESMNYKELLRNKGDFCPFETLISAPRTDLPQ